MGNAPSRQVCKHTSGAPSLEPNAGTHALWSWTDFTDDSTRRTLRGTPFVVQTAGRFRPTWRLVSRYPPNNATAIPLYDPCANLSDAVDAGHMLARTLRGERFDTPEAMHSAIVALGFPLPGVRQDGPLPVYSDRTVVADARDHLGDNASEFAQFDIDIARGADIITIHGLDSNVHRTWATTNDSVEQHWPTAYLFSADDNLSLNGYAREQQPQLRLPAYTRVLNVKHNMARSTAAGAQTMERNVQRILECLSHARVGDRPIVWLAHGFGGLVLKELLHRAQASHQLILLSTRGIIFFGTPHHGAAMADSTTGVSAHDHRLATASPALRYLHPTENRNRLDEMHQWFLRWVDAPEQAIPYINLLEGTPEADVGAALSEMTGIPIPARYRGVIVTETEGRLPSDPVAVVARINEVVHTDTHRTICKMPPPTQAARLRKYQLVQAHIARWIAEREAGADENVGHLVSFAAEMRAPFRTWDEFCTAAIGCASVLLRIIHIAAHTGANAPDEARRVLIPQNPANRSVAATVRQLQQQDVQARVHMANVLLHALVTGTATLAIAGGGSITGLAGMTMMLFAGGGPGGAVLAVGVAIATVGFAAASTLASHAAYLRTLYTYLREGFENRLVEIQTGVPFGAVQQRNETANALLNDMVDLGVSALLRNPNDVMAAVRSLSTLEDRTRTTFGYDGELRLARRVQALLGDREPTAETVYMILVELQLEDQRLA